MDEEVLCPFPVSIMSRLVSVSNIAAVRMDAVYNIYEARRAVNVACTFTAGIASGEGMMQCMQCADRTCAISRDQCVRLHQCSGLERLDSA